MKRPGFVLQAMCQWAPVGPGEELPIFDNGQFACSPMIARPDQC
jgi:hypothetical protein